MDKQTIQTYNSGSKQFAQDYEKFADENRKFIDLLLNLVASKNNPLIVELGCGNGRDAEHFKKYTDNYLGIDASKKFIELAKTRNPSLRFELANMVEYDFPDNIDLAVAFASLLHLNPEELQKLIKKITIKLKPNGILAMTLIHGEGQFTRTDDKGVRLYYRYTPDYIQNLLNSNFELVSKENTFPYSLTDKWNRLIFKKKL